MLVCNRVLVRYKYLNPKKYERLCRRKSSTARRHFRNIGCCNRMPCTCKQETAQGDDRTFIQLRPKAIQEGYGAGGEVDKLATRRERHKIKNQAHSQGFVEKVLVQLLETSLLHLGLGASLVLHCPTLLVVPPLEIFACATIAMTRARVDTC